MELELSLNDVLLLACTIFVMICAAPAVRWGYQLVKLPPDGATTSAGSAGTAGTAPASQAKTKAGAPIATPAGRTSTTANSPQTDTTTPTGLRKLRKRASKATGMSGFFGGSSPRIKENYFVDSPRTPDAKVAPTKETVGRLVHADGGYERADVLTALLVAKGDEEYALARLRLKISDGTAIDADAPATPTRHKFDAASIRDFSAQQTEAPPPKEDGPCPQAITTFAEASLRTFEANQEEEGWATGRSGNAKKVKEKSGVVIRSRAHPGGDSRSLQWRVDATFVGTTADAMDAAFLYENRISWDPAIANPAYLRRYVGPGGGGGRGGGGDDDDDLVDVCCYNTKPAAGGFISSRSFVDIRVKRTTRLSDGCVSLSGSSFEARPELDRDAVGGWLALADGQGLVRARNLSGSGLKISERMAGSAKVVDIVMITTSEIGGSLPVGVVNGATGDALFSLVTGLHRNMQKSGGGGLQR